MVMTLPQTEVTTQINSFAILLHITYLISFANSTTVPKAGFTSRTLMTCMKTIAYTRGVTSHVVSATTPFKLLAEGGSN